MHRPTIDKSLRPRFAALARLGVIAIACSAMSSARSAAETASPTPSALIEPATATQSLPVHIAFAASGLSSIKAGETELVTDGDLQILECKFAGIDNMPNATKPIKSTFDSASNTLSRVYPFGKLTAVYTTAADRLNISVSVTNNGPHALARLGIRLVQLTFPSHLLGHEFIDRNYTSSETADDLPAILADWGPAHLAFCSDDLDQFEPFGFLARGDQPYDLWVRFGGEPFRPGTTRQTHLSLRLAGSTGDPWSIASDLLQKFAAKYPSELKWDDHRPIGSAFLATSEKHYPKNPRGYLLDPDIDVTTPEGRADFKTKMMVYADSVVAHCKTMNAQGVIVWDLEGQEMPHATSYLADPRVLSKVSPEMDAFADEFMKKFSDAGLRTGVTIRPTRVTPADQNRPGWMQADVSDQVAEIDQKLTYAEKRWGCSIFYVDSNVDFVKDAKGKVLNDPAMPAAGFQKLARRHPKSLLMPEHKTARYWAYTAPYSEYRLGINGTPAGVREAYPTAFSLLQVVDGPSLGDPESIRILSSCVKNGDVLLFRPWWDDPQTADLKHIYDLVAAGSH